MCLYSHQHSQFDDKLNKQYFGKKINRRVSNLDGGSKHNTARYLNSYRLVTKELPDIPQEAATYLQPQLDVQQANIKEVLQFRVCFILASFLVNTLFVSLLPWRTLAHFVALPDLYF
jgi:hypothetical protein